MELHAFVSACALRGDHPEYLTHITTWSLSVTDAMRGVNEKVRWGFGGNWGFSVDTRVVFIGATLADDNGKIIAHWDFDDQRMKGELR